MGSRLLYEPRASPAGGGGGGGAQETPGLRARRQPSTCLPPTEPPPRHKTPRACHLDGTSCAWLQTLLLPCSPRAPRGTGHRAVPKEGLCPPRSPEVPGAPWGAKEKPSPASLHAGRASGSSRPVTSKPAGHQMQGRLASTASRIGTGALESARLVKQPSRPSVDGAAHFRMGRPRLGEPGLGSCRPAGLSPSRRLGKGLRRAGTPFPPQTHLSGYKSAPATWKPEGPVVRERERPRSSCLDLLHICS